MAKVVETNTPSLWMTMERRSIAMVAAIGMLVGLLTYALYLVFSRLVFEPLLCGNDNALVSCETSGGFANILSIVIASTIGLVFLVRERVFRPLLVVLAVAFALTGLVGVLVALPWFLTVIFMVVAYVLAYVLFAWLAQPTNLVASITATIVVVALARLAIAV